jgi:hypothetical protein
LNVHEGRAAAADLLATCSTNDVGADALMEVGISELLRTHTWSAPTWVARLARRLGSLARYERNTISDI